MIRLPCLPARCPVPREGLLVRRPCALVVVLQPGEKPPGPWHQGYATGLWNLPRVVKLIETECGVRFGKTRVWQLLRALGWSCQRPTGQARERDKPRSDAGNGSSGPG